MKNTCGVLLLSMLMAGCYTTKVYTRAQVGPEEKNRQWFTLAGLVPLSGPAGEECPAGLARAESQLSGGDILINVALAAAGAIGGAVACRGADRAGLSGCITGGANLLPFFLASRTVRYVCAVPGGVPPASWPQPNPQGPPVPYSPPPGGAGASAAATPPPPAS